LAKTQTVTIIFTDMVGSTVLSSRLGPEASDKVRQEHFSLLRQALAASEGIEVKNLGDGLMAVFPSPSAAVACAVAMQQAVGKDNRRRADPLGLRVGLSGGEVTVEDDDYFGDPVVEAARVCAICEGGQILATETVRSMAGRRSPHRFADAGNRQLKGMPEPIELWEIPWAPMPTTSGTPLPEGLQTPSVSFFGFIGRERERQRLIEDLKSSAAGSRRLVFISGEPGIGKTSLSRQVAQAAHEFGVCVLYGRCDEDLVVSYQPLAQALGHLVVHGEEALLKEHVEENGGALISLVPALAKRIPEIPTSRNADPESERVRLFRAAVSLLAAGSSDRGGLLVIDDLHWADKASLLLLKHICVSTQLPKLMVLGTYRDSELSAGNPLSDTLASISREGNAERINLLGLEDFEILEMMERLAGHTLGDEGVTLAHTVRRETEGNPFYSTELLRHLGESGLIYQNESGRWLASSDLYEKGLPQSVRAVIGQRVERLGEETRKVLSQAAVIGREFDVGVLAAVVGIDEDALLDIIDNAIQAGLLVEVEGTVERFSFAHALTQHTLYEDLGATRRTRAHRKIADVLETIYGSALETRATELARHFVAATKIADPTKALRYSKMAGDQALSGLAPADALDWYSQALDLYPQVPADQALHCDLLLGLGTAQVRTGDLSFRGTLLEAAAIAKRIGDTDRLVAAALANTRETNIEGKVDDESVALLQEALQAIGKDDSPSRALLLATLGAEFSGGGEVDLHLQLMAEAMEMARRLEESLVFLKVATFVWGTRWQPDALQERLADLGEAVSIAEIIGDPMAMFTAHQYRAYACLQSGSGAEFEVHFEAHRVLADVIGQPGELWAVGTLASTRSLLGGDTAGAEEHANAALAVATDAFPEAIISFGVQLMAIRAVQGRVSELAEFVDPMAQAALDNPTRPGIRAGLARLYFRLERHDDALAVIQSDLDDGFAQFPYDLVWLSSMAVLSDVCVALQRRDAAGFLHEKLAPWHSQIACLPSSVEGPVALHLGELSSLLGDQTEAETYFSEALSIGHDLRSPYWIARTQLEWSRMLFQRMQPGDAAKAKGMLIAVLDASRRYGFGALREQAEVQL
jgi:class 3 adenylate cyclase